MSTERIPGWRFINDQEWRRNDGVRLLRADAGWTVCLASDQPVATVPAVTDVIACGHIDAGAFVDVGVPATREFTDEANLPSFVAAIRHMHQLEATWLESVPVVETHEGQTVWAGEVQVFAVEHPKASRVYAWSHETSAKKRRFHVVLGIPPVTGPERAVRVAVLSEGAGLR